MLEKVENKRDGRLPNAISDTQKQKEDYEIKSCLIISFAQVDLVFVCFLFYLAFNCIVNQNFVFLY